MPLQKTPVKMYTQMIPLAVIVIVYFITSNMLGPVISDASTLLIFIEPVVLFYLYYRVHKLRLGLLYSIGTGILLYIIIQLTLRGAHINSEFHEWGVIIFTLSIFVGYVYLLYYWTKSWNSQC